MITAPGIIEMYVVVTLVGVVLLAALTFIAWNSED